MHVMLDHQTRLIYAKERAEMLRNVMRTTRSRQSDRDAAGRSTPARERAVSEPRLRVHRGTV